MGNPSQITVCVVYALPDQQHQMTVRLPAGATVEDAVRACGLAQRFAEIGSTPKYAIFSRVVAPNYELKAGDRVEILRPLLVDPKDNRRKAARSLRLGLRGR